MKRTLLSAKSIAYSKEGASKLTIAKMLERLGITEQLKPRTVLTVISGQPVESVAKGENELAFALVSEIITVPGAELLGLLPAEFQNPIIMAAGVSAKAKNAEAANAIVRFLTGPKALPTMKASGMEPLSTK